MSQQPEIDTSSSTCQYKLIQQTLLPRQRLHRNNQQPFLKIQEADLNLSQLESTNMASNTTTKDGVKETIVETVDYRSPAGQGQEEKKDVEVIHQSATGGADSGTGGIFAGAASAVANTIESAKKAISDNTKESNK